jgi:hypothetical protein
MFIFKIHKVAKKSVLDKMYCDVLPVNTSNNFVGCGFCYLDLLDVTSGGVYNHL